MTLTTGSASSADELGKHTEAEVKSQPEVWAKVLDLVDDARSLLPAKGARVLALGCGTSYYIADSYARLRQSLGHGRTRAMIATELDPAELDDHGPFDVAVLLTRSGTTSDLVRLAGDLSGKIETIAVTGTPASPITEVADSHVLLDFADERSVVQTRFATSALTLFRASAGDTVADLPDAAREALADPLVADPADHDHLVFLGTGWTLGLADEAALKCRESAQLWTEAYATLEYRHGPISCAGPRSLIWSFAPLPADVIASIEATGATLRIATTDPQAELVRVHRLAIAYARARGLDCDTPVHLSRAVIVK
ncbi:SIS domain-containing protein [Sinosporangium siamense]|uniref:Glutamine--fructose-6-phosphate aminotransferase n=1 Tax=Sinosporangium siamense TaxID=1367973 RepID=A0A919RAD5_9ACTN|nr:SIS domain-containing protein [Sinosporangium siamense]GII89977.1 glutamine--fructose-6-phosphate aminotransferase [Sinosporangium siamense]